MPKITYLQSSFSSGELSPLLKGRVTLAQYQNGCETLKNMVVLPQGGITKRPGTKYIQAVKDSSTNSTLIPFVAGIHESYMLEFGHNYIRFYKDGGALLSSAAITNGTFASDVSGWTDGDTGTGASTWSAGVMRLNGGAAGVAIRTQAVSYVGTAAYTLTFTCATNAATYRIGTTSGGTEITSGTASVGSNSIAFTPALDGTIYIQFRNANNNNADIDSVVLSTPVYQIYSPYESLQVNDIQWAQTNDIVYLAHPDVAVRKLRRQGAAYWDIVAVDLVDGPYYNKTHETYGGVGTGYTMTPSATAGSITFTASGNVFASTDVGRAIRYRPSTSTEWSESTITAYTSPTQVTALVQKVLSGTTASTEWRLGYFSQTTGYPACISFHEQRLVLANTMDRRHALWFSRAGDIEIFQPDNDLYKDEVDDTSAMTYNMASRNKNSVCWLSSKTVLYIGTYGGVFVAKASALEEAITPTNISIRPLDATPAYVSIPVETNSSVIYIHHHQRKIEEFASDGESKGSADLAILSEHLGKNRFEKIVIQEEPYNIVWAYDSLGLLYGLTYLREQSVVGWSRHEIGGSGKVISMACIPGQEETELWMIVERTINGSTVKYVELLTKFFRHDALAEDAIFVDSSITYDGSSATALTGLDHLEGEDVAVWSDGYVGVVSDPVTSGAITLQEAAEKAQIGLAYDVEIKTTPIYLDGQAGSLTRAWKAFIRLHDSALIKAGYSSSDSDIVETLSDSYTMGGAVPLISGVREVPFDHGAELEMATYIKQEQPAPLTVLSIGTKLLIDDDR